MNERKREALISDLERLAADIPELIAGLQNDDEKACGEAKAVVQGAYGKRFDFLMNRLTDHVVDEAMKGNTEALRRIASGEAFK
jgi:hypothetical protein